MYHDEWFLGLLMTEAYAADSFGRPADDRWRDWAEPLLRAAITSANWTEAMKCFGHRGRSFVLQLLAGCLGTLEPEAVRDVLSEWWNMTEGMPPRAALPLFLHAGYSTDTEEALPGGTLTIYRGVRAPRHRLGVCWTVDPDVATHFAARLVSPGRTGVVYEAEVESVDVLGYFTSRDEAEVIVDPATLKRIRRFAEPMRGGSCMTGISTMQLAARIGRGMRFTTAILEDLELSGMVECHDDGNWHLADQVEAEYGAALRSLEPFGEERQAELEGWRREQKEAAA
jgi:hypothetical protein